MPARRIPVEDRFWPNVDKNGPVPAHRPELGPCWVWTASRFRNGYGRIQIDGRSVGTHRVSLGWSLGRALTADERACHNCDNPPCVNNEGHLFVGSESDNASDRDAKHRRIRLRTDETRATVAAGLRRRYAAGLLNANARKTHCKRGHELTPENTRQRSNGYRACRACQREADHVRVRANR